MTESLERISDYGTVRSVHKCNGLCIRCACMAGKKNVHCPSKSNGLLIRRSWVRVPAISLCGGNIVFLCAVLPLSQPVQCGSRCVSIRPGAFLFLASALAWPIPTPLSRNIYRKGLQNSTRDRCKMHAGTRTPWPRGEQRGAFQNNTFQNNSGVSRRRSVGLHVRLRRPGTLQTFLSNGDNDHATLFPGRRNLTF